MRIILPLLATSILALYGCKTEEVATPPPAPQIQVVSVISESVKLKKDFVGQVYGKLDIPIRARVEGFLEGQHFREGLPVKKGQLLYTVDSQPFDQAVAAAQSSVAEADVALTKANNELQRVEPLAEMSAVSERDLDAAIAEKGAAEAMLDASHANLRIEEIRRGYTKIESPINGIIGKTNAKIGEFVGREPNPVILNTVSLIDSVRVEFFITENDYLDFMAHWSTLSDEDKVKRQPLELILADGTVFEHQGNVDFIDRQIDETTGTMLIQSTFPNPAGLIRPGQFARVRVVVSNEENGILIPQRCVSEFQGLYNVMLVDDEGNITQKTVDIIGPHQDYYLIRSGVEKGDLIVFEGLQKVGPGMQIDPITVEFQSQYSEE